MNDMNRNGFANFLLGLGVGVGIGMLFAPKAGGETRDIIKNKAGEGKEFIKQRSGELRDSANDLIDKGKSALGRQKDTLADAVEAGKQAYREAVNPQPSPEESAQ
jgi:gas vesicle protein